MPWCTPQQASSRTRRWLATSNRRRIPTYAIVYYQPCLSGDICNKYIYISHTYVCGHMELWTHARPWSLWLNSAASLHSALRNPIYLTDSLSCRYFFFVPTGRLTNASRTRYCIMSNPFMRKRLTAVIQCRSWRESKRFETHIYETRKTLK